MMRQDRNESEEMVKAILQDSGVNEPAQQLIKSIFQKQQEILLALEDIVRNNGYQQQSNDRRLNELLEKVDPKEAEKRKQNLCGASAELRLPGRCLI